MTFEFLIACRTTPETDFHEIFKGLLSEALENSQDEFDEDSIDRMVRIGNGRTGDELVNDSALMTRHAIFGLNLELPEMASVDVVVNHFATSLLEPDSIFHVVRFEDPLLQDQLARYATEIFVLEMKLRRVLSFIYLHVYQRDEDPYDLLREEQIRPMNSQLTQHQMQDMKENQFFHLLFSQYINLNKRPEPSLDDLRTLIRDSEQYDSLRGELLRSPITDERDANLLSDLKELMDPIEQMRNCVAHNRRPSSRIAGNYSTTRPRLDHRLDDYLAGLEQCFNSDG